MYIKNLHKEAIIIKHIVIKPNETVFVPDEFAKEEGVKRLLSPSNKTSKVLAKVVSEEELKAASADNKPKVETKPKAANEPKTTSKAKSTSTKK